MDNILVLGASGFIGHYLADRLLPSHRVIGYSRHVPDTLLSRENYVHVTGDFATERDFERIFEQYEVSCIYHCISTTTPREGTSHIVGEGEDNIISSLRLLEAASKHDGMKLVFLSSGGTVYGENYGNPSKVGQEGHPICTYGIQKRTIEEYIQYYSANTTLNGMVARISNPYGVVKHINKTQGIIPLFFKCLWEGRGITLYGDTVRDYIHIDDVVNALIAMKRYDGTEKIFNIGSGRGVRLSEVVAMMEEIANKQFLHIGHSERRVCDVQRNVLDIEKTKALLRWEPKIDLKAGMVEIWNKIAGDSACKNNYGCEKRYMDETI